MAKRAAEAESLKGLGAYLHRLRLLRNRTQQDVADLADVDVRYISRVELGRVNPTYLSLLRIMKALDICSAALPPPSPEDFIPRDLCACIQNMMRLKQGTKMRKALECFDKVLDIKPLPGDMMSICPFVVPSRGARNKR